LSELHYSSFQRRPQEAAPAAFVFFMSGHRGPGYQQPLTMAPSNPSPNSPPYDTWLQWEVPLVCNLACAYCGTPSHEVRISRKRPKNRALASLTRYAGWVAKLQRMGPRASLAVYRIRKLGVKGPMQPIDTKILLRTLERTGRTFRVGFSGGGEPFLVPNLVEACEALAQRHYVALNSNLVSTRVRDFARKIPADRVVHFHASMHIRELERLDLVGRFVEHYLLCKEAGLPIFAQEVAHPSMAGDAARYRREFAERGVQLSFGAYNGVFEGRKYPQAYTDEQLEAFGLDRFQARETFSHRGKRCIAGVAFGAIGPDGTVRPCSQAGRQLGHVYSSIRFGKTPMACPFDQCTCPPHIHDSLFRTR